MTVGKSSGTRSGVIRNCAWGFACGADWKQLKFTDQHGVKFCPSCQREVYETTSDRALIKNIKLNRCVYFEPDALNLSKSEKLKRKGEMSPFVGQAGTDLLPYITSDDDIPY